MPRTPENFVRARREAWSRLHELVDRSQNARLAALSDEELHEMGTLYRRASADLARAQTRYNSTFAGQELVRSLNALVLRAHAQIYSAPPASPSRGLFFFLFGFPAAFRRHWRPILLAAVLMFGSALCAYVSVWTNEENIQLFITDPDMRREAVNAVKTRAQNKQITGWGANTAYEGTLASPEVSSRIMTNNIRVTIMAVALGVTAGLGTALVLMANGLMIGGLAGAATNANVDYLFWSVILPHGVLELTAICIAGGAGLLLARAIYAPGDLPRRDALRLAGGEAVQLLAGVAMMLILAGLIEGFITPTTLPPGFKLGFAALTGVLMVAYLCVRPKHRAA
ncbi:MAG: stage II sporulation protein M [Armatimonadetes bacterium]|nr:stage II sporulation protein M [Armatimonadota bacterium]